MHMAVANGFPPQTYSPLLQPFTAHYNVMSLTPRPLWADPPPPSSIATWDDVAADLLDSFEAYNMNGIIGIGHSLGGVATLIAASKAPERFRGIVLLDPTIFPRRMLWALAAMRTVGLQGRFPLVQKALKRRAHFTDKQEAFAYWRKKSLFRDWPDETLWLYVEGLTEPAPDGGLQLAWSPEWEARIYATIYTRSWAVARRVAGKLPVLTVRGTESNTFFEGAAAHLRRVMPDMTYAEIKGHGHLFPQTAPDETRAVIADWLRTR